MHKYNKIRGILRAKQGSQIPKFITGGWFNQFLQYNQYNVGSPVPQNKSFADFKLQSPIPWKTPVQQQQELMYNQLLQDTLNKNNTGVGTQVGTQTGTQVGTSTNNSQSLLNKSNTWNAIGQGADMLSGMFASDKDGYQGKYGNLQQIGDQAFDQAANAVMAVNPLVGGIMKVGGLVSDVLTTYGGMGTDSMTKTDAILGSKLLSLTPVGMINGFAGKKTKEFGINQNTINQVGSSYGGSVSNIMDANSKANKKYGLFSSGSRRKANKLIDKMNIQQNMMTDIADNARDMQAMAGNDFNYTNYQFGINGGYDQRYMRAAKSGMKIVDKINLVKQRRFNTIINLDTKEIEWEPIISEVEEFKEGGVFSCPVDNSSINYPVCNLEWEPEIELFEEWEPIITDYVEEYKEGGNIKEELETPKIEETNQKNLIPEGALHKNKHHMEHTEGLTQKGIPVIDNNGDQQAEIELDEIIFTLEVTKKLEELYKDGSDEAAIEAGKLLVKEILFNTDDRTGLIAKCEEGGKLDVVS